MGRKHRNPWGGPPIDDLALKKHYNRDGSKLTIEQVAGAWLRPIYTFPPPLRRLATVPTGGSSPAGTTAANPSRSASKTTASEVAK